MQLAEQLKMKGRLHIVVRDALGKIKDEREIDNMVVTAGRNHIAARMKTSGTPNEMSHMAVGTGAVAAALGDTTLGTESARVALATSGGTVATNVVTYAATFPAGTGTAALTEAGILNAASVGTLLCRTVFSVINKGAADSMTITWTVTIS